MLSPILALWLCPQQQTTVAKYQFYRSRGDRQTEDFSNGWSSLNASLSQVPRPRPRPRLEGSKTKTKTKTKTLGYNSTVLIEPTIQYTNNLLVYCIVGSINTVLLFSPNRDTDTTLFDDIRCLTCFMCFISTYVKLCVCQCSVKNYLLTYRWLTACEKQTSSENSVQYTLMYSYRGKRWMNEWKHLLPQNIRHRYKQKHII